MALLVVLIEFVLEGFDGEGFKHVDVLLNSWKVSVELLFKGLKVGFELMQVFWSNGQSLVLSLHININLG